MGALSAPYRIGYCTSGFPHHRLEDALGILQQLGYRGVFLTLDVHHLNPLVPDALKEASRVARLLDELGLQTVVETGARYLLDPWRKHQPVLLSRQGAARREAFLKQALRMARELNAPCISTWSGSNPDNLPEEACFERLAAAFERLIEEADRLGVAIAFEPEPGMFIETVAGYHRLKERLGKPCHFGLSLDVGHLLATGEGDPAAIIREEAGELMAVALEDMRRGVHEHLPFGEGELDLPATLEALGASGFQGVVAVELSRHGHQAVALARRSRDLLQELGVPFGQP